MAERDELERRLAQARQVMVAPAALKSRVLGQLLPAPPLSGDAAPLQQVQRSAAPVESWLASARRWLARGIPMRAVALLVGIGFGAGFWLGRQPAESGLASIREGTDARGDERAGGATLSAPLASSAAPVTASPVTAPSEPTSVSDAPQGNALPSNGSQTSAPQTVVTRLMPRPTRTSAVLGKPKSRGASPSLRGDDALSGEIALLARVERAIRSGEARLALALLDDLDRDFPVATLSDERAAAQVLARCILPAAREPGTSEEQVARSRAERFLGEHVASVYSDRIRSACALAERASAKSTASKGAESKGTASKNDRGLDTQRSEELK